MHSPVNDKRLRRAFFALVYVHGAVCTVFGNRRHYRTPRKDSHRVMDIGHGDFVCMYEYYWNLVHIFVGASSGGLDGLLFRVISDTFAGMGAAQSTEVNQFVRDTLFHSKESCWPKAVPERIVESASRNGFLSWLRRIGPYIDGVPDLEKHGHIDAGMPARRLCQELELLLRISRQPV